MIAVLFILPDILVFYCSHEWQHCWRWRYCLDDRKSIQPIQQLSLLLSNGLIWDNCKNRHVKEKLKGVAVTAGDSR